VNIIFVKKSNVVTGTIILKNENNLSEIDDINNNGTNTGWVHVTPNVAARMQGFYSIT